jgi:hypothetical protein
MKPISALIFYLLLAHSISAQNAALINYHTDCNKGDLNQVYTNTVKAKIKSLDNTYFEDGYIVRSGDTIKCKIYLPKHKINDDNYVYIIAKLSRDSNFIYSSKDINGYGVNGVVMRAHCSVVSGDTNYFFIKLIEKGRITVYNRAEIPSDKELMYYFQKAGENNLLYLAPNKKNDIYLQERDRYNDPLVSKYKGTDEEQFRTVFAEYLKDCETIRNKILSKFYTINDIPAIIKDYNACTTR